MGEVRTVRTRAERFLLRWRTRWGRRTAVRYLDLLAVAVKVSGYRCVKLYQVAYFPRSFPLLWVYASGAADDVGVVVSVQAIPGGRWAYHAAQRGSAGHLSLCGDVKAAAEEIDRFLKHQMFPSTW